MRESAPSVLHNMSAPPRSTVDVRPLRAIGKARGRSASGLGDAGRQGRAGAKGRTPSGEFFARVCLVGLLHDGRAHELCAAATSRVRSGENPTS